MTDVVQHGGRPPASRRDVFRWAAAGGLGVGAAQLLAACSQEGSSSGSGVGDFPATPKWKFVFINHVTTNPFFVPTKYGIDDACAILGATSQWTGSEKSNATEMVNAMNAAISSGADGIAVALVDQTAFNEPTKKALDAGIPVVSYNADSPKTPRLTYVGQDLYDSGFQMGQRIVADVGSGDVAIFIATPGQLNIQPRADGAKDAIKQSGKPITAHQVETGPQVTQEISNIESFYLGHKDFKGFYAVDAGSTQGVAQLMDKYKLKDKGVHGGGYDLLPKTIELLSQGVMDFTINQEPYMQGFLPVLYMYLYQLSGRIVAPPLTNTGLVFLTPDQAKDFQKTKSRFEGDSSKQKYLKGSGPIAVPS